MRSLELRLKDPGRALEAARADAETAPESCDAQLALALVLVSGPRPEFEKGGLALAEARKLKPQDPVLAIGVYFVFLDALLGMHEDARGLVYEFKPTPLRNAADWLLSGKADDAYSAFKNIAESGRQLVGLIGQAAALRLRGERDKSVTLARSLLDSVPDAWLKDAVYGLTSR